MPDVEFETFDVRALRDMDVPLSATDRRDIAAGLRKLLRDYYVHLPQKVGSMAINPDRELELLADDAPLFQNNLQFFDRLISVFAKLRDRHTTLRLPAPFNRMVAFLPLVLESCWENGRRKLLVARLTGEIPDERFVQGVEVTHWNGTPVAQFINRYSWTTQGSNPYARIAMAQRSLTLRPLAFASLPEEDWVTLSYVDFNGDNRHVSFPWKIVFAPQQGGGVGSRMLSGDALDPLTATQIGLDEGTEVINFGLKTIFSGKRSGRVIQARAERPAALMSEPLDGSDTVTGLISASILTLEDGRQYGYLRIFSFSVPNTRAFSEGMAGILGQMPPDGLIIDVRGNPGGTIPAGEALLHLITDKAIEPTQNVFRATQATRRMSERIDFFQRWSRSLDMVYETGQTFSQGFELSDPADYAGLEGSYRGPLAVIMDALSYSTTDYFVAGFQDNSLGEIIGTDPTTGAGGANVWSQSQISGFAADAGMEPIPPLPHQMDCRVAVRRALRAGVNRGLPLEGLGATANHVHFTTRRDILGVNEDLMMTVVNRLREQS
ncbi:S41 family peptidase [Loktanella sp. SALINAS62]|uniref:S41 family peptidase n=1 Tax=Loktanella sp. SALINAS62 TaxID=2706124 RepID=UPI001B8AB989|nr:S41 family peptidase [Loktanella sp. SALINAS62]MBS1302059.1 hypothetical protein [Loktanella sp. SALINAS62]